MVGNNKGAGANLHTDFSGQNPRPRGPVGVLNIEVLISNIVFITIPPPKGLYDGPHAQAFVVQSLKYQLTS